MFDREEIARAAALRQAWEAGELRAFLERQPESRTEYRTLSGVPLRRVYTAEDLADLHQEDLGLPGQYPYTRGPYPTMYRGRLWTMRQIAGFGTGEDTNGRFRYLIEQGQTGLSVDFDMPTLMGYDSDDPRSVGEVGREGVAVDTIEDMEALFEGIDLERISVSMTINPTAWILLAMYVALAESRGYDLNKLSGTVQADILKEYIAQKEWIFPIRPSMRIMRDMIVYCAGHMARYNPINISGYHISEAGATSVQEVAFTMANAVAYVEEVTAAGVPVDDFAPRLAFYFVAQADFFEEVAKFRAARRIYAKLMRERFHAMRPESMRLRFHCQTAAATLTKTQPLNNVVRVALQALSAILGGAQSLHTDGMDEAYGSPRGRASGEQPVMGVNLYAEPGEPPPIPIHKVDPAVESRQIERLRGVRARRDNARVATLLDRLEHDARDHGRDRGAGPPGPRRLRREARFLGHPEGAAAVHGARDAPCCEGPPFGPTVSSLAFFPRRATSSSSLPLRGLPEALPGPHPFLERLLDQLGLPPDRFTVDLAQPTGAPEGFDGPVPALQPRLHRIAAGHCGPRRVRGAHGAPALALPQLEALVNGGDEALLARPRQLEPLLDHAAVGLAALLGHTLEHLRHGRERLGIRLTRLPHGVRDRRLGVHRHPPSPEAL